MPGLRPPPPLYAIADIDILGLEHAPSAVATMSASGIEWIQIRAKKIRGKRIRDAQLFQLLERCLERIGTETKLWINDRVDVAALLPVAGVHVGQSDLPPTAVRSVVTRDVWVGQSTHNLAQAEAVAADPDVDLVALGPIFPTGSKQDAEPVVGLELLRQVRRQVSKPLVAIGGINASNLSSVLAAGADSVAILGALCHGDVRSNSERLVAAADKQPAG